MRDTEKNIHDSESDDNVDFSDMDSDLDETSITIGLNKGGEKGSGYHTQNNPTAPFQRATATERRGIIQMRCNSREIIHGGLFPKGENATLLIYDFHLDTTKRSRRIRTATLEFEFKSSVPGVPAPEVQAIAPEGRTMLLSSTAEESTTRGYELKAGASQFVDVGGSAKLETTVSQTTSDEARVTGHISDDGYGKGVGAKWVLHENPSIGSGTPSFLRCAILLNRKYDEENFECSIKVKAEADWKTELKNKFFGETPRDDPILFDPTLPSTNKLRTDYDTENLGALDLDEFVEIVFGKSLKKKIASA